VIFKIIAFFVIALVGIGLLLAIVSEFAPNFTGPVMCRIYQTGLALMPVSESMKPQLPWYCTPTDCTYRRVKLPVETDEELSGELAKYLLKCWECSEEGKKPRTFICYELYSERETDERSVTQQLKAMGRCGILPNNFIDSGRQEFDCGDKNKIYWEGRKATQTIIIKYDAFTHRLVVS
jgi:hypothetical protein